MVVDHVFFAGCLGGVANEALHWWGLRLQEDFPEYAKRMKYWLVTLIMAALGGCLAYFQLGEGGDSFIAFQLGLMAPLLLKKLLSNGNEPDGRMGGGQDTMKKFLKG